MPEFLTLRIPGARRAARQSELHAAHRTPQHARPKRAPKAFLVEQRIERARDAWAAGCATEDEKALVRGDRDALLYAIGAMA